MSDTTDRLYECLLVVRCQAGDEGAFAELIERYQPRLRYYLRKMLRDVQIVEDTLQNLWLVVFRSVCRLADAGAFRAWLYRIARDQASSELRKRRPTCQLLEEIDPLDTRAEEAIVTAEDVDSVHAALDELSAEHREVLVLRYIEDMSYEEIARVVGCQLGTVRSRLHYAKLALRGVLERMKVHD